MKFNACYIYSKSKIKSDFGTDVVVENLQRIFKDRINIKLINQNNYLRNIFFIVNCNIIHLHGCWRPIFIISFIIGKIFGKKIFFSPHGMLDTYSVSIKSTKKKIAWYLYQKIISKNSIIICNSLLEKNNLKKLDLKNINYINHGINLNHNYYCDYLHKPKFVFFSRIHPIKNILELILVWKKSDYLKSFSLDIYGKIEDLNYYHKLKELIKNESNIKYKYSLSKKNKYKVLSKYNVYLFPSKTENFGITVLEALSCGLYVVCNKNLPWQNLERFNFGKLIYFTKTNLEKVVNNINKTLYKRRLISKKKVHSFLRNYYSWSKISKKYWSVYIK
jgi:glycosyltransferase involved in cell wall biosynthesis